MARDAARGVESGTLTPTRRARRREPSVWCGRNERGTSHTQAAGSLLARRRRSIAPDRLALRAGAVADRAATFGPDTFLLDER